MDVEPLTDAQERKIRDWHQRKNKHSHCVACGQSKFNVFSFFTTRTIFDRNADRHVHSKVLLTAEVHCENCGFIYQYDAEKIGFGTRQGPHPDEGNIWEGGS